ncbi:uncharacterized protein LOC131687377 [Topomyia yanbarensis]|uniref:uncharacterized protein LOC131687377 n=1 Tax=Topomyia yanbarensis TaxID=2498891 RepID=UPI00273B2825|nr:uncharacterized protein LOC131687377 [Topomyia yanbarensis]
MSGLERKIQNLKTRRRSIATSFNLIRRFVAEYNAERDAAEVPVRIEAIVSLWADFNTVQAELETTDESPDALEGYLKERAEFESLFYMIKGFLLQHVPATTTTVAPTPQINPTNRVKLPDVKLPIFEGKFETWLNFHDLFVSLVHSSTDLSSIQKFYYLRSSLGGEALKLIQTIPISATNYPVAWNLLVEHFQNPTVLKRNYVQTLFDFPTLRRESATDLHALVEQFEANVRVLNQLGEHTEYWDILLVHFLASRLDSVTRRDWEEHSAVHETISFRGLTDFIQRRVNVLQQITTKPVEAQQQHQSKNKKPYQPRLGTHGAFQDHRSRKCIACSEEHTIYQCNTFARLPIDEKERLIKRNHLCRNCFRRGHFARECASESCCKKCKARHHTLLCTKTVPYAGNSSNNIAAGSNMATLPTSTNTSSNQRPVPTATVAHSGITSCNSQVLGRTKVILATAVIVLIDDAGKEHLARVLLDSGSEYFYVDDLYSGAATVEEAIELRKQLDSLLSAGGFQLRKWASNIAAVLNGVSPENRAIQEQLDFDRDQTLKKLGCQQQVSFPSCTGSKTYGLDLPIRTEGPDPDTRLDLITKPGSGSGPDSVATIKYVLGVHIKILFYLYYSIETSVPDSVPKQ